VTTLLEGFDHFIETVQKGLTKKHHAVEYNVHVDIITFSRYFLLVVAIPTFCSVPFPVFLEFPLNNIRPDWITWHTKILIRQCNVCWWNTPIYLWCVKLQSNIRLNRNVFCFFRATYIALNAAGLATKCNGWHTSIIIIWRSATIQVSCSDLVTILTVMYCVW